MYNVGEKRGFTLIELLVVIAIIGVLSTIGLVAFNGARARARDAKRASDLKQYFLAYQLYYDSSETYMTSGPGGTDPAPSPSTVAELNNFFGGNGPKDPLDSAAPAISAIQSSCYDFHAFPLSAGCNDPGYWVAPAGGACDYFIAYESPDQFAVGACFEWGAPGRDGPGTKLMTEDGIFCADPADADCDG